MTQHELTITTPVGASRFFRRSGSHSARPRTPRAVSRHTTPTPSVSMRTRLERFAGEWVISPADTPTQRCAHEYGFPR